MAGNTFEVNPGITD